MTGVGLEAWGVGKGLTQASVCGREGRKCRQAPSHKPQAV
jgi:hypothetical protein